MAQYQLVLALVAAVLLPWLAHAQAPAAQTPSKAFLNVPQIFEANAGQVDEEVKFLSRGPGYTLFLTPTEAVVALAKGQSATTTLRMSLVGASARPRLEGLEKLSARSILA